MPGLVAAYLTAMIQEHERSAGGSQAEWPIVAAAVQATGAAVSALADAVDGLSVDPQRMRRRTSRRPAASSTPERAVVLLAPLLGRDDAQRLVTSAVEESRRTGAAFVEVLRASLGDAAPGDLLAGIDRPEDCLGAADTLRTWLLNEPEE